MDDIQFEIKDVFIKVNARITKQLLTPHLPTLHVNIITENKTLDT